jgi:hypothetical protein
MIWARIETSSEDTGSSSTISRGSDASARAIATLAHPTAELVGEIVDVVARNPTCTSAALARSRRSLRPMLGSTAAARR